MEMDDEITHPGIVHRCLSLGLPGVVGGRVVGIDTNDINAAEIGEADTLDILKFPAKDQVKQLRCAVRLGVVRCRHPGFPVPGRGPARQHP